MPDINTLVLAAIVTVVFALALLAFADEDEEPCAMCSGLGSRVIERGMSGMHSVKCPVCAGTGHRSGK